MCVIASLPHDRRRRNLGSHPEVRSRARRSRGEPFHGPRPSASFEPLNLSLFTKSESPWKRPSPRPRFLDCWKYGGCGSLSATREPLACCQSCGAADKLRSTWSRDVPAADRCGSARFTRRKSLRSMPTAPRIHIVRRLSGQKGSRTGGNACRSAVALH